MIKPLVAVVLLLTGGNLALAQSPDCSMDRMEIDPAQVVEACTTVLETGRLSPSERGMALFVRGRGYHRTGRVSRAGSDYVAALLLIPANDELYVSRANVALRAGRYGESTAFLRKALALNPTNVNALRTLGAVHYDQGLIDDALKYYNRALEIDPTEPYSLEFRSRLHARFNRYAAALEDANALVAIPPDIINRKGYLDHTAIMQDFHVVALKHRADILERVGNLDLAKQDLDRAVTYRHTAEALIARGEFLVNRKKFDEALKDFESALAIKRNDQKARYQKGIVLIHMKRESDALATFDHLLDNNPHHGYGLRMRARLYRSRGETERAVRDYVRAMEVDSRVIRQTIPAFQHGGYWRSQEIPEEISPELLDAVQACMLDTDCN